MSPIRRTALFVALVATLAAAMPSASTLAAAATPPREWTPWLLSSADQFRLDAPPDDGSRRTRRELRELRNLQDERTPKILRRIEKWNGGPATVPWTKEVLRMIVKWRPRPAPSARLLAYLHTAMYDALIAASDSRSAYDRNRPALLDDRIDPVFRSRGSTYPPEQAVIAGAAETILKALFPLEDPARFERLALQSAESRLYAGVNYRSDVTRGLQLGRDVAGVFLERMQVDGSTNTGFAHPRPDGPEYWSPTPPGFESPIGGPVGTWLPWLMSSPDEVRLSSGIPGPSPYGSESFRAETLEVIDVNENLTPDQESTAFFWDDGPATFTPPGHWNDIALDLVDAYDLGTNQTARIFATLNAVEADAVIAFFEAKYYWWSIRPITAIRRLCEDATRFCTDEELAADPSLATYPSWDPIIITPPFPSYPSGHSTFSGGAGAVLSHFFPDAETDLTARAEEAAMSRLYGGIHFREDNDDGLVLGRKLAELGIARAAADGSGL